MKDNICTRQDRYRWCRVHKLHIYIHHHWYPPHLRSQISFWLEGRWSICDRKQNYIKHSCMLIYCIYMSVYTLPAAHSPVRDVGSTCGWSWGCWWLPPPRGVCFEVLGHSSPVQSPNLLSPYQSASLCPWIYARHWKYRCTFIIGVV